MTEHWWGMLIDIPKCIGCGNCVRACQAENDVPDGYFRTWVERYHVDDWNDGEPGGRFAGRRQGRLSRCTRMRSGQVLLRSQDVQPLRGLALHAGLPGGRHLHHARWRGAGRPEILPGLPLLRAGLPLRLPLHPSGKKVADKCTLCYHRITKGLTTACCEACPTGARQLADLKNPNDPIHEFLKTHSVQVLKPQMATGAKVFYNGWMARCDKGRVHARSV